MPCLLVLLGLLMPRFVLLALALFSNWYSIAYQSFVWPILGWFFMPFTTLAYMVAMVYNDQTISNGYLVLLIVAVLLDFSSHAASTGTGTSSD